MKRSALLAGLMVLAAASSAAAQGRPNFGQRPQPRASLEGPATPGAAVTNACPPDAYSVVRAPDGSSVSILFHAFTVASDGTGPAVQRARCRIEAPLVLPAGYGAGLTSVDYRGFALLDQRQFAEIAVDYEVGAGNRAPRFQRRIQGRYGADFAFTDRLPPGRLRQAGCGARGAVADRLSLDVTLTLSTAVRPGEAMVSLDSADQASRALTYRFDVQPCARPETGRQPILRSS